MRRELAHRTWLACALAAPLICCHPSWAQESTPRPGTRAAFSAGQQDWFRFVQRETEQPRDVDQPRDVRQLDEVAQFDAPRPLEDVVSFTSPEAAPAPTADLTEQLVNASSTETIRAQRRSPISFDPRIRGYRGAQIYSQADGAWWRPSRDDLDTMLSKLAPSSINSVRLLNGPYGVTYGPGFAFIDVLTTDTPRNECHDSQNTIGLTYRANGDQWYGYDAYEGGASNWGYRFGYGNRTGIDYESGNGTDIPSSYHSQDYAFQFGYDINPFQKVEFRYLHVDQDDTEYFGRFFDINALTTDAFNLRLIDESPSGPWTKFVVEGWYNQNPYHGDTLGSGKATTMDRVERALERALVLPGGDITFNGFTAGYVQSIGARGAVTFGDDDTSKLVLGADARYLRQQIVERFFPRSATDQQLVIDTLIDPFMTGQTDFFETRQPTSWMINPGLFAEATLPLTSYWKAVVGARVDWIQTDVHESEVREFSSIPGTFPPPFDLAQNNTSYAFFLNNEVELDEVWTANLAFGYAQRPPTLTERYADGIFLGIFQNGFSRVIGNPFLDPERAWQVDVGIRGGGDDMRGGARVFHSWILDYATYEVIAIADPTGAILVRGTQSDMATLAGFELYGDWDSTDWTTLFGNVSYIDGRDRDIDAPMTGIYPFETRVGIRLHEPVDQGERSPWAIELFGRLVDDQHRIAAIRNASGVGTSIVEAPTPSFMVWHLRGLWEAREGLQFTAGVDNLFDRNYLEHLDLRLPAQPMDNLGALSLFAPGITPYIGVEWTR